ncbi:two-component system sensor histidine kinase [Porphyromonas crevioricanis JCM 15906]|uniref:histidine kinase n=1 Tax=Porphyromonas crevioricanis JCM 15906 TaxID=1305617 RepID=T1DQS9_9PORP|nr:ATP-binding protein [Porphyromonas crevioricanis]GAD04935.1 two-component system sensor histidine kinase [Porphyromonas crevioricanis JCM 15906]SJZ74667.1 two-component system, OmpR family, phosphate regulon sensor histidine kinase PhoR [Porphyromonas crevioricanis]
MKNRIIGILVVLLMTAFVLLFVVQVLYIRKVYEAKDEQFNRLAKVALSRVSAKLELDEMRVCLYENLMSDSTDFASTLEAPTGLPQSHPHNISASRRIFNEDIFAGIWGHSADSLPVEWLVASQKAKGNTPSQLGTTHKSTNTATRLQMSQLGRYLHKRELLNEVILRTLIESEFKSTKQRIKVNRLTETIRYELDEVGLKTAFLYKLYNAKGGLEYFETLPQYKNVKPDKNNTIRQYLFLCENDSPSEAAYVDVIFPEKQTYEETVCGFAIPVGISALVLLVLTTWTVYILYKKQVFAQTKTDFINNMTHELKTPVSSISLASQMMRDEAITSNPQTMSRLLGVISSETQRLSMLIEKVLQFSLFEDKRIKLKMQEVDANEIILGVAEVYSFKAQQTGGNLDLDLEAEDTWILADEMHLTNAIFNLLENAVKYRQPDRKLMLAIHSRNVGKKIEIVVQDNGIGIPPESQNKIFKRFYRVHTGNRHDVKGFGLGLAYVHMVLQEMGGSIRAESKVGEGTKMIITLPNIKQNT